MKLVKWLIAILVIAAGAYIVYCIGRQDGRRDEQYEALKAKSEDHENRLAKVECNWEKHGSRWKFLNWCADKVRGLIPWSSPNHA